MIDNRSIIAVVQARMGSTRLPGKVLMPLADRPALWHVIERLESLDYLDGIIIATSEGEDDDSIVHFLGWLNDPFVTCFRGSENDVLGRFYHALSSNPPEYFLRITGDSPLLCVEHLDRMIRTMIDEDLDGVDAHRQTTGLTLGFGGEAYTFDALQAAHRASRDVGEREHVSLFIKERAGEFRVGYVEPDPGLCTNYRLTLDYAEDYALLSYLYDELYREGELLDCREVLDYLRAHPGVARMNMGCVQRTVA
ncbi:MAG: cytidylyltransferase domain-containing protein [Bradymonadaceae bacterium]